MALCLVLSLSMVHLGGPESSPTLPSEQLLAYSANNLDHLLGPLNGGALPRAELLKLEIDYQGRLPQASPAEKEVLNAAIKVGDAFSKIGGTSARRPYGQRHRRPGAGNAEAQGSTVPRAAGRPLALDQKRREIRQGVDQN